MTNIFIVFTTHTQENIKIVSYQFGKNPPPPFLSQFINLQYQQTPTTIIQTILQHFTQNVQIITPSFTNDLRHVNIKTRKCYDDDDIHIFFACQLHVFHPICCRFVRSQCWLVGQLVPHDDNITFQLYAAVKSSSNYNCRRHFNGQFSSFVHIRHHPKRTYVVVVVVAIIAINKLL